MSLGNTLRTAREACGLTTSELAARTHMLVQIVEGLENEDFRRIPAPIYGRGFIKLYCEAVDLDPKPLQAEFMDLFNRAKDAPAKNVMPEVRSRPQTAEPPPQPTAPAQEAAEPMSAAEEPIAETADAEDSYVEEVQAEEPPVAAQSAVSPQPAAEPPPAESLFDLPIQTQDPAPVVNVQPPPKRSYGDLFGQAYATEEGTPKQSAAEKFRNTMSNVSSGVFANVQKLPPNTGRIVTVSLCAAAILCLIGWGVFELYKATTPGGNADAEPAASAEVAEEKPEAKNNAVASKKENGKTAELKKASAKAKETPTKTSASKSSVSVKPGDLKSSGIEVPALYID